MKRLYLTIDDSPSANTGNIVDFLNTLGIQALFFSRGDRMRMFPVAVDYLLQSGHLLGAHGFAHKKASSLSCSEFENDLMLLDREIEEAYSRNGMEPQKYFRFPYFDKGSDSFPCDPRKLTMRQAYQLKDIMLHLRSEVVPPSREQLRHKNECQKILHRAGYGPSVFRDDVWNSVEELRNDCDIGASVITADWKLLPRYRECYGMTVPKLCAQMDEALQGEGTAIVLTHDYDEYEGAFADFRKIVTFLHARAVFRRFPCSSLRFQKLTVAG